MDWSVALGLTKEAPVDTFFQGLQFNELQKQKKLAAAQKAAEERAKLGEKLKYDDIDIHPSYKIEYQNKANEVIAPAFKKFREGTLTPQDVAETQYKLKQLKEGYEGISKSVNQFQTYTGGLTNEGKSLQGYFTSGLPIEQIRQKQDIVGQVPEYSGLISQTGDVDLSRAYLTANPFDNLRKEIDKNEYLLGTKTIGGSIYETRGMPLTEKERKLYEETEFGKLYGSTGGVKSIESLLIEQSYNPSNIDYTKKAYGRKFKTYYTESLVELATEKAKQDGKDWTKLPDSEKKKYVSDVRSDNASNMYAEQKAYVNVGLEQPWEVKTSSRSLPKGMSINIGGGQKGSETNWIQNGINNYNYGKIKTVYNNKNATGLDLLKEKLSSWGISDRVVPSNFGNSPYPRPVSIDITKDILPVEEQNKVYEINVHKSANHYGFTTNEKGKALSVQADNLTQFVNAISNEDFAKLQKELGYENYTRKQLIDYLSDLFNQVDVKKSSANMSFKNSKGDSLTDRDLINPDSKKAKAAVYAASPYVNMKYVLQKKEAQKDMNDDAKDKMKIINFLTDRLGFYFVDQREAKKGVNFSEWELPSMKAEHQFGLNQTFGTPNVTISGDVQPLEGYGLK